MSCLSCGTIEGFTNDSPAYLSPSPVAIEQVGKPVPEGRYTPYMKSECSFAAQACMYTAQGEMVCPKGGLGDCGGEQKQKDDNGFFGLF